MSRQGRGLKELVGKPTPNKVDQLNPIPAHVEFYGVIRNKGGSGERHLVKKLSSELLDKNKRVFVCYENSFSDEELTRNKGLPLSINKLVNVNNLTTEQGGIIKLSSFYIAGVNRLFSALKEQENCAVIFTIGTGSAIRLISRTKHLLQICERIFIAVKLDSVQPNQYVKNLILDESFDSTKIDFYWRPKILSRTSYKIAIKLSADLLIKNSEENLNQIVEQSPSLQKECSLL